ncbi:GDSL-like lipase/acylhydrolase family protein [Saccharothrix carnea]|uniref:GDSL-like lipase/acylhydrolase family protein n=2 Tax=Saccharothrix carnea TaxID=1280637 RepID=A0A2P8IFY1_SACCR|nr:GDSL-like lipase/acylhydrolase family protein [Saccharothrix carnea]
MADRGGRWLISASVLVLLASVVAVTVKSWDHPTDSEQPSTTPVGPLTVVTLGDSILSGEGAGAYETVTDGVNGNWCHRSANAVVHRLDVAGVEARINLACSGASTEDLLVDGTTQWTEPSQTHRLAELAKVHRIAAVVVSVGANDDPGFSRLMSDCLHARILLDPPCSHVIGQDWRQRLDAVVPKVSRALRDVRSVLAEAGYGKGSYQLIQLSYTSPLAPDIPEELRNLSACPFHTEDLAWIRDHAVGSLSDALREAAERADARFLDLSRAGHGHEACTGGDDLGSEWFTRLTLDWDSFGDAERVEHVSVQSFHPNSEGHRQFARCIGEFLGTADREAACVPDHDGDLRLTTDLPNRSGDEVFVAHPR